MEQRFRVAQMLEEGKTYLEIQEETGASTATISRVGKVLNEGTGVVAGILERKRGTGFWAGTRCRAKAGFRAKAGGE